MGVQYRMRLANCAAPMARDLRPWALCRQLRAREVHHSGGTRETPAPCSTSSALSGTRRGASPRRRVFALNASSGEATRPLDEKKAGVQQGLACPGTTRESFTKVYKFGGSSVADAERMRQVAKIVCLFENEAPVVVLSAMGKTTNNLIIAGEQAVLCRASEVKELEPLRKIRELHEATLAELEVDQETCDDVMALLDELTMLLVGLSLLKDLTPRSLDSLVSFGERLSTRIFSGYLRRQGVPSVQHDAFEMGIKTTDQFTNGDVLYEESVENVRANLRRAWAASDLKFEYPDGKEEVRVVPVVTGFLGQGEKTGAITTLGRGGSDLTATFIGMALGIDEVVVWKDVDGVMTTDPRVVPDAKPIPLLTVEEATELAYFGATVLHPQSMQPLLEKQRGVGGSIPGGCDDLRVRVKNSYNTGAPGSVICAGDRNMEETVLTSIVLKSGVNMLDIVSTRMLGQYGFLAKVFSIFEDLQISVDVVATSEVSVSVTLDISKIWARDLDAEELLKLEKSFDGLATVKLRTNRTIISLIGNADRNNEALGRTFAVLTRLGVNPEMISKGAFKNNVALIVPEEVGDMCLRELHREFFP